MSSRGYLIMDDLAIIRNFADGIWGERHGDGVLLYAFAVNMGVDRQGDAVGFDNCFYCLDIY